MRWGLTLWFTIVWVSTHSMSAAPLSGSWEARHLVMLPVSSLPYKISDTQLCLNAILNLAMNFSGIALKSRTSLSLIGLETEFISIQTTVGALTLSGTLIFSRNIIEADSTGLIIQVSPNPGGLIGTYLPYLPSYTDPITPLATLCTQLAPTLESDPVIFRKKIVSASLNVMGLKFSSTLLLGNLGTIGASLYQMGALFSASGQTVSGIEFESLTYIGMRNEDGYEFECFGQCHSDERFYQGRVVPGFNVELERINLKKIVLAGVHFDIASVFNFNPTEGTTGLKNITFTSSAEIERLSLTLTDILTLGNALQLSAHTIITTLKMGEGFLTAVFTDLGDAAPVVGFEFKTFIVSYALDEWNVTNTLYLCAETDLDCAFLQATYQHDIQLSHNKNSLTLNALIQFFGLIANFNKLVVTLDWALGSAVFHSGTAIQTDRLAAQEFALRVQF